MKKYRLIALVLMLIFMVSIVAGCGGSKETAANGGEKKPVTIRWATISGFYTDWATKLCQDFEEQSGIKVEVVQIDNAVMYEKQGIEMASKTGAYDLVTNETMWKAEWANAGYIIPLDEYIDKFEMREDMKNFDPGTLKLAGQWNGKTYSLPFYTYNQGMFVRQDLFDDETEKAAFKQKYDLDLKVVTLWFEGASV